MGIDQAAVFTTISVQRANDVTRARRANGQPVDAASFAATSGGRTSYQKSDTLSRCVFIYLMNNPTQFHSDAIWNDAALGFFWRALAQHEQEEQQQDEQRYGISSWSKNNFIHNSTTVAFFFFFL